jgi:hypothetical protein
MLLVRNSVLIATLKNKLTKQIKLNLGLDRLFAKQMDLINKQTVHLSEFSIDMSPLKEHCKNSLKLCTS